MTLRAHKNPDRATTGNPEKSILIIFNFMLDMSYFPVLVATVNIRECPSHKFLNRITDPSSCLHHLPAPKPDSFNSRLRGYEIYPRPSIHTKRCCSFV